MGVVLVKEKRPKILFYVQNLLGLGHLQRAAILARNLSHSEFDVVLVVGGRLLPCLDAGNARVVQLPSLHIGAAGFYDLRDEAGNSVDENWKNKRRDILIELFRDELPDIFITEAFPFGRRQMRFELIPLLDIVKNIAPRVIVVCSVRDILKSSRKSGRVKETVELIDGYYDLILVHGDEAFVGFDETFPETALLKSKIVYTGFICAPSEMVVSTTRNGVVVSAGGGAVGIDLLEAAIGARKHSKFCDVVWHVLAGPNLAKENFLRLKRLAPFGITVERYRYDFRTLLAQSAVSVSQAGYNSVADILMTETPSVLVPFDVDGETEQPLRAKKLAKMGRVKVVESHCLSPKTLAAAVNEADKLNPKKWPLFNLEGAKISVNTLREIFISRS